MAVEGLSFSIQTAQFPGLKAFDKTGKGETPDGEFNNADLPKLDLPSLKVARAAIDAIPDSKLPKDVKKTALFSIDLQVSFQDGSLMKILSDPALNKKWNY